MFTCSARFYDALYAFKDYVAAAEQLRDLIGRLAPGARSLLDVGCGTGRHLEELQRWYTVEGLDIDPQMVTIARGRLPGVPVHEADMVGFDLHREFDVVTCLFSAIAYVRTPDRLQAAVAGMARHVRPGGLLLVEPWISPEQYWVGRVTTNFVDEPELKIAWMYTSEIDGRVSVFDINYLVGTPEGVEHLTERHEMGLFTEQEYLGAFEAAGVTAGQDAEGPFGRGLYVGIRRGRAPGEELR
ncbi:class I SAM-dependent methyltransferase [Geodermatophilus sp. SYSU D00697]